MRYLLVFLLLCGILGSSGVVNATQNLTSGDPDVAAFQSVDNASAALWRGQLSLQNGQYEEALASYNESLKYDPTFAAAWYLKGYALSKLNRTEEALVAVDRSLALEPGDRDSRALKADLLERLGRQSEAAAFRDTPAVTLTPTAIQTPVVTPPTKAPGSGGTMLSALVLSATLFLRRDRHP